MLCDFTWGVTVNGSMRQARSFCAAEHLLKVYRFGVQASK
jgi:hypothetical protein